LEGKLQSMHGMRVNIHNKWYLIDNTWGAGYLTKGGNFERQLEMEYLFTNPNDFIIEHFPNDSTFQLLEKPITNNDFESSSFEILREKKFKDILD
jgi:transglutaminase/protease-like cytokinesis protein 3